MTIPIFPHTDRTVADYALGSVGDSPISWFVRKLSCVVLFALSVHPPDFTSRDVCLFVGHRETKPEDTGPHEYRTFCYIE